MRVVIKWHFKNNKILIITIKLVFKQIIKFINKDCKIVAYYNHNIQLSVWFVLCFSHMFVWCSLKLTSIAISCFTRRLVNCWIYVAVIPPVRHLRDGVAKQRHHRDSETTVPSRLHIYWLSSETRIIFLPFKRTPACTTLIFKTRLTKALKL